jgi:hypothetical protein
MSWLRRFFGGAEDRDRPSAERRLTDDEMFAAQHAQRLTEIINESMQLSRNSVNPSTKVSRLELARARLEELKALSARYPFIRITELEGIEKNIEDFGREYASGGFYAAAAGDRLDYAPDISRAQDSPAWSGLIQGARFCATLQLRTPLRVLTRHGESWTREEARPPIARESWEGFWAAETVTWRELGIDLPEMSSSQASEIGPVPSDGGEFLKFLVAVRTIVEADGPLEFRRLRLRDLLRDSRWQEFVKRLEGTEAIVRQFFPPFIETIKGLSREAVAELWERGLTTPALLSEAPDRDILSVRGIGPAKLRGIREACAAAASRDSEFVDLVQR